LSAWHTDDDDDDDCSHFVVGVPASLYEHHFTLYSLTSTDDWCRARQVLQLNILPRQAPVMISIACFFQHSNFLNNTNDVIVLCEPFAAEGVPES